MTQQEKIAGIFTPNVVPLDGKGEINEAELRRYVDWLIAKGVHGLYPNGSTGEFTRFTVEERRRIVRIVCEQAAGRVAVLAGAAEANVRETLQACELYAEYGARAVAIVSPIYYKLSQPAVFSYFYEIACNSPIDVTLYNIPMFASPIDVDTVRKLAECERIVGIKDSSGDAAFLLRLMAVIQDTRPDFSFLVGWEPILLPMLLMGVDGATLATSGVVPEVTRRLYDLAKSGQISTAIRLQLDVIRLFDTMLSCSDFPLGFRTAVSHRGFELGQTRQPVGSQSDVVSLRIQDEIQRLLTRSTFD